METRPNCDCWRVVDVLAPQDDLPDHLCAEAAERLQAEAWRQLWSILLSAPAEADEPCGGPAGDTAPEAETVAPDVEETSTPPLTERT
jgi:hypothetical protein